MDKEQKLKHSIYSTSRKISREVADNLEMQFEPNALDLIAELVYKKVSSYGSDLEAFQKHAKRSTMNMDDVRLLVRKNESLKALVESKLQTSQANKPPTETNASLKRKRKEK